MIEFAAFTGYLAGSVQLAGYVYYNVIMVKDPDHEPNASSWFMWAIGAVVEVFLYHELVQDPVKEFLPKMCAVGMILTFAHSCWRYGLLLKWSDWKEITMDLLVVLAWSTLGAIPANIFMGLDVAVSYKPIIQTVREKPLSEQPGPWAVWTVAYTLLTITVLLDWKNGYELIFPVVSSVVCAAVWYYSYMGRRVASTE